MLSATESPTVRLSHVSTTEEPTGAATGTPSDTGNECATRAAPNAPNRSLCGTSYRLSLPITLALFHFPPIPELFPLKIFSLINEVYQFIALSPASRVQWIRDCWPAPIPITFKDRIFSLFPCTHTCPRWAKQTLFDWAYLSAIVATMRSSTACLFNWKP